MSPEATRARSSAWALLTILLASPFSSLCATFETAAIETRSLASTFWLDGVVEASRKTTVSAQTGGQIIELFYDVDDVVAKNAVVARLKDTEQKAELARSSAALQEAEARMKEAADAHRRTETVFAKQAVSRSEMDRSSANLKAARAQYQAAEAGLERAREQLEYTLIRAPYAGIVTERHVEVGETASPGTPIMSGLSLESLRVNVDAPQRIVQTVREKREAYIRLPLSGDTVQAQKVVIFPYADPGSATFRIRLELPEEASELFPGMFVKAGFVTAERPVLTVPAAAIVRRGEVTAVYVVGDDERISFRQIRLGRSTDEGNLVVLAGLQQGERVALDPVAAAIELKAQRQESSGEH